MKALSMFLVTVMIVLGFSLAGLSESDTGRNDQGAADQNGYDRSRSVDETGNQVEEDYPYNAYGGATGYRGSQEMGSSGAESSQTQTPAKAPDTNEKSSYVYPGVNADKVVGDRASE